MDLSMSLLNVCWKLGRQNRLAVKQVGLKLNHLESNILCSVLLTEIVKESLDTFRKKWQMELIYTDGVLLARILGLIWYVPLCSQPNDQKQRNIRLEQFY
jgi:hypothetical protein